MKEKNLLTSFIDFIDERTSSIVPFKYLVAKTNARKISMLLLTIIMLSTFSPVAMSAQGLFSDALDNISSNTGGSSDTSSSNDDISGGDLLDVSDNTVDESETLDSEEMMWKIIEEAGGLSEEERIEGRVQHAKEIEESIWNQSINDLSEKELKSIGIVETEEKEDIVINQNFKLKEFVKMFSVINVYDNLSEDDKTEEVTATYNSIVENGFKDLDLNNLTNEEQTLLNQPVMIMPDVTSVIKYNGVKYTLSSDCLINDYAVMEASTVAIKDFNTSVNAMKSGGVNIKQANIRSGYTFDGHKIVVFADVSGGILYCIDKAAFTNPHDSFADQRSPWFQSWSPETQLFALATAYNNGGSLPPDTTPPGLVNDGHGNLVQVGNGYGWGTGQPTANQVGAAAIIWAAEDMTTGPAHQWVKFDDAVQYAKDHSTVPPSAIDSAANNARRTIGTGAYERNFAITEDCSIDAAAKQDLIMSDWGCRPPETSPWPGAVKFIKKFNDQGYPTYDKQTDDISIKITNSAGDSFIKPLDSDGTVTFVTEDSDTTPPDTDKLINSAGNPWTWEEVNNSESWETVHGGGTFNIPEDGSTVVIDTSVDGPENKLKMGDLTVTKEMINDTQVPTLELTTPGQVNVCVDDDDDRFDYHECSTLDDSWQAHFDDMPYGQYVVTEATSPAYFDEYYSKGIITSGSTYIDDSNVHAVVNLKNEIKWGNLKVVKDIVNDTAIDENTILDPSDVYITVESEDGYSSFSRTQSLDSDWSTTFDKLPWGNYHVIESVYDEDHSKQILGEAYIVMDDVNPGDENTRELSIAHPGDDGGYIQNEILWANLLIRKDIINETDLPTNEIVSPDQIRIDVQSVGESFDYHQNKPLDSDWEAFFDHLPVGHYRAEEQLVGNAPNSLETIIGSVDFEVTAADDEQTIEISIDNPWNGDQFIQNRVRWANLYIEKNMVNDTATPTEELTSPEDVWIKVESVGESFNYYEEHQLDSNWSTTFEKMPVGHYHVEEYEWDQEHSKRIMWDTEIDVTPADDKLTLEMSKDNPWPGTDFYIENEILWANLLVTKNMINDTAVPVEDITSPDQVEITVESLDGYHIDGVHTSITKTLNNHWEALFPKLPVGHYRITETTWDETHTKQIQNIVEIEITPADDETIIYIDKDHPVGDAYIENEILWANVLITKNMINDTEIPTDDITSPSQVVITLESLDGYRLDGTNTSISGTLDSDWSILFPKIPVGHYKVTETVWDQTHTKQIMSEVTFEVKPEDDESIIYIDKDNPVGDAYIENEILWANVIFTKDVINLDDFSEDAIENIDKSQIKIHVQSVGETFSYDKTLSLDDDWSVMFEKLPVGHYHYTEELPNPSNMEVLIGEGDFEVTPADDETIIRIDKDNPGPDGNFIQNRLKEFTFRLTVRDSITEERLGAGYEFAVYDEEPEVEVVEGSDVFGDEGDEGVLTDSDHDYITDEIPLFTMQTDREGEAVSPVLPFDTDGTQDLYIYETDVETDQYGNETYFLNDGGILLHAEADVSDGEEIQVEYFNLKKDYAQMRTNTSVVDTEGNSVEDFDLSGFEYTIFDKDENSENYGNIAESVAVDGIPAEEQILVSDADGKANSGVLHANLSLNSFNNKPADERMDYTVEPSGFPDGMTEEMFKQVPDPYDFSTNGLTKLFYYDAVYVIDDATLEIDKVDQDDNPLEDAEFTIYEDLDTNSDGTYITDTDKEVDTITSDENGIAKISLPRSADYYVQETEAPEGYDIDETVYKVEFNEEGKETIKVEDELISEKIRTDLILYNKDGSTGQIITEPATFELRYTYDGHEEVLTGTTTSGKIEFNDVPVVDTDGSEIIYTLKEVKAPGDYTIDNNEYQFELYFDSNGDIQYETVYSQATGKLETTTQDATAYTGTGTLEDIPEDVNDTTVDMDFYNYKEDSASDIVDEMPDTALGFFVK